MAAGAWTGKLAAQAAPESSAGWLSAIQPRQGHLLELGPGRTPVVRHGLMEIGYAQAGFYILLGDTWPRQNAITMKGFSQVYTVRMSMCAAAALRPWGQNSQQQPGHHVHGHYKCIWEPLAGQQPRTVWVRLPA